ncbi:hypothetical protein protein [Bacillus cereus G9241]|nr:hypothetical protein protein [Bacillus cereus G9241]
MFILLHHYIKKQLDFLQEKEKESILKTDDSK